MEISTVLISLVISTTFLIPIMIKDKMLVIGATGQIGVELTLFFCKIYREQNVVASDLREENLLLTGTGLNVALEIEKHVPGFTISNAADYRQQIADSWPQSIDDSVARNGWGWNPAFDLSAMTTDMFANIQK